MDQAQLIKKSLKELQDAAEAFVAEEWMSIKWKLRYFQFAMAAAKIAKATGPQPEATAESGDPITVQLNTGQKVGLDLKEKLIDEVIKEYSAKDVKITKV